MATEVATEAATEVEIAGATLVTVLRHGAVQGRPFVYRGSQDDPLADLGWRQMQDGGQIKRQQHGIAKNSHK